MIDGALPTMIDEVLISSREIYGLTVAPAPLNRHLKVIMLAPTASLFDQSALTARAERAVAMARAAPEDKYAGLADDDRLAHNFPDLDLLDPNLPTVQQLETMARAAE